MLQLILLPLFCGVTVQVQDPSHLGGYGFPLCSVRPLRGMTVMAEDAQIKYLDILQSHTTEEYPHCCCGVASITVKEGKDGAPLVSTSHQTQCVSRLTKTPCTEIFTSIKEYPASRVEHLQPSSETFFLVYQRHYWLLDLCVVRCFLLLVQWNKSWSHAHSQWHDWMIFQRVVSIADVVPKTRLSRDKDDHIPMRVFGCVGWLDRAETVLHLMIKKQQRIQKIAVLILGDVIFGQTIAMGSRILLIIGV